MVKVKQNEVKSRGKCFVTGCNNSKRNNRDISFHEFPKERTSFLERLNYFGVKEKIDRRDLWLKALDLKSNNDVSHLLICSAHFKKSDYNFAEYDSMKQCLKKTAVPSQNLPNSSKNPREVTRQKNKKVRSNRLENRNARKFHEQEKEENKANAMEICNENPAAKENEGNSTAATIIIEELPDTTCDCILERDNVDKYSPETELNTIAAMSEFSEKVSDAQFKQREVGIQVETGNLTVPFLNVIKNEKNLFTLCGISSFKILHELVSLVREYYPTRKSRRMDVMNQIILVTMKLKLDISFSVLQILFAETSLSTCCDIFYDMLKKLSRILQATIQPVSKTEILNNMPDCFKNFEDTVIVLDCTEILMQKPKCLKCRIKFYSQYKSNFTFKFMTGVSPGGLLTYVSKSYGGRASDKSIFEQSNIIQSLTSNRDAIMVDKGFLIEDICAAYTIKLIRPPFLRSKKQFSKEEADLNRKIAAARVHVERMNQRIRIFTILNNCLQWNLRNDIDDIFNVCCGLANLGTPILSDDKFM